MEGSSRVEGLDEVDWFDDEALPTPKSVYSLHAPFKRPRPTKEPPSKMVKVEPSTESSKKLYLSPEEERALLSTMKDLALDGWKAGQGWKRGTYPKAVLQVSSMVKGSRITAKNVVHKLHSWGKQYRLLYEFLKLSGVAIDHETYMVVVDSDDMWAELSKENNQYAVLRGKTFPHYNSWCELFGKHRATGSGARDHKIAETQATATPVEVYVIEEDHEDEEVQESVPKEMFEQSPITSKDSTQSGPDGATSVARKKVRKGNDIPSEFTATCISFERFIQKKENAIDDGSKGKSWFVWLALWRIILS